MHDRIFDRDAINRRIPECREQISRAIQFSPNLINRFALWRVSEPADSGVAEPRAWWMGNDEQIPSFVQQFARIPSYVAVTSIVSRQQIARPGVVPPIKESIPDSPRKLASN